MADKTVQLSIKVNSETGALEVLGAKLRDTTTAAKEAQGGFAGLTGGSKELISALGLMATVGGIVEFFKSSVEVAEKENQALQRLKYTVEGLGGSWDKSKQQVQEWGEAVAANTRFSEGEALNAMEKLARVTGDVTAAEKATQLAMGLSVVSGKELGETTSLVTNLLAGNHRALIEVKREFGAVAGAATTNQEALDLLSEKYLTAAENEKSFTRESAGLRNAFEDLQKEVGQTLIPALTVLTGWAKDGIHIFNELGFFIAQAFARASLTVEAFATSIERVMHGDFSGAKQAFTDLSVEIKSIDDQTVEHLKENKDRELKAEIDAISKSKALKAAAGAKDIADRQKEADKLASIEAELNVKIAALGDQTFATKRAKMEAEIALQRTKIGIELKDAADQEKAIQKLEELHLKEVQQMDRLELQSKILTATEVGKLAMDTLAILNDMGNKHSAGEVARAKAIITLQQAIAIARVWAAEAEKGVAGIAIASASTGLIMAQMAQQFKAVDQAAAQSGVSAGGSSSPGSSPSMPAMPSLNGPSGPSSTPSGGSGGGQGSSIAMGPITITNNITIPASMMGSSDMAALLKALTDAVNNGTANGLSQALGQKMVAMVRGANQVSAVRGG